LFECGSKKVAFVTKRHAAGGIRGSNGADNVAALGDRGSGADAALEILRTRAVTRTDAAERKIFRGVVRGRVTEIAIGREAAPVFVATRKEIEQNRAGHDRNTRGADRETAALLGEPRLYARTGVESEGRAPG
jgi:hypothetical protein